MSFSAAAKQAAEKLFVLAAFGSPAAKASTENQPLIAAVNRCATKIKVARRIEDLKAGKAVTIPWEELHRELLTMGNER